MIKGNVAKRFCHPSRLYDDMMMAEWSEQETSTHQDHVVAHVIGTTVLGYFVIEEAAHLLLDIGFIWTILLDGEMGLVTQSVSIAELLIDGEAKAALLSDAQRLHDGAGDAPPSSSVTNALDECLITEVEFYAHQERRRIVVKCEGANLLIETSLVTREITVEALADDAA